MPNSAVGSSGDSGAQYYQRVDNAKFEKFFAETGVDIEAGCGIDTTVH